MSGKSFSANNRRTCRVCRAARSGKLAPLQDSALAGSTARTLRGQHGKDHASAVAEACCPLLWGHHGSRLSSAATEHSPHSLPEAALPALTEVSPDDDA
jgi:hypothetical protein